MKLRGFSLCVSIFIDCGNQSIHYYRLHSNAIDWFPIMIDFHRLGTLGQEAYDQYDHLVPPNDQTLWRSASCGLPSPSSTFVKTSASPAFHKFLLQKRSLERYSACNKIEFAINCAWHCRLRSIYFPPFEDFKEIPRRNHEARSTSEQRRTYASQKVDNERSGHS